MTSLSARGYPGAAPPPSGACLGCPFASRCHPARQLVHDRLGESRRTSCPFYQDWRAQEAPAQPRRGGLFFRLQGGR